MTEQEKAEFDRRVRLALEREPDWKEMLKDPVIQWIGVDTLKTRLTEGRFDALRLAEPIGWACLIDRYVRDAWLLQALDDVMRDDLQTVVRGLHALRVVHLAFLPWTLSGAPDGLAWALFSRHLGRINDLMKLEILGVERMTPDELTIWKYALLRGSHWSRHARTLAMALYANEHVGEFWKLADWSASDWDETTKNEGWVNWFFTQAHSIAVAGIELIEDVAAVASRGVVLAAQGVGLIPDEIEVERQIRWMPDPFHPRGVREIVDTETISPLARMGETVITGVGEVDDALRRVGMRKSARIFTMALGTALGVVVTTKAVLGVGKLAKWPFAKLWGWWHAPAAAGGVTTAKAMAVAETLTVADVSMLPAATQMGIGRALLMSGARAGFMAKLGSLWTAAKLPVAFIGGAAAIFGGMAFGLFGVEEADQQMQFHIRDAQDRADNDYALAQANKHIAWLEKQRNTAMIPAVGPVLAFEGYIENAIDITKKKRDWMVADETALRANPAERKKRSRVPKEAEELVDPKAPTPQKWDDQRLAEVKAELASVFLELRRIRIWLGHKRLKAGEDVSIETTNIPLLRTFISRDRKALVTDRNAAQQAGTLEDWIQKIRDAGFNENVLQPTDLESVLVTQLGFKDYKKFNK